MSLRTQGTIPVLAVLLLMLLASLSHAPTVGPDGPLSTAAGTQGPAFNLLLEDRAAESELDGDDENEADASEWEVID